LTLSGVELVRAKDEEQAASIVAAALAQAARGGQTIVLTGGKTPRRAYELAAGREADWSGASVWWGDERCVAPEDHRSNYKLARDSLLDRLSAQPRETQRIRGELGAEEAAAEYDAKLRDVKLDLVLLGLGPDGHTASLFPGEPTLEERERRAIPAAAKIEPLVDRVTMTVPVLCFAPEVLFLVSGEAKAEAVERAFAHPPSSKTPASLIRSAGGRTRLVADRAAASRLRD
jgi:6-phosphogluconolactonase